MNQSRFQVTFTGGEEETYDPSPRIENYCHEESLKKPVRTRPSLEELHNPRGLGMGRHTVVEIQEPEASPGAGVKFGWIQGVFLRSMLNIFGAVIFMRMGLMVGEAGLLQAVGMVILSTAITMLTTTSVSALCTNGKVGGGGPYYLVARSLGPEAGAVVGLMFVLANISSASMYLVAAAENVTDILNKFNIGIFSVPSGVNDIRLFALVFLVIVVLVIFQGISFESKAQVVLLVSLAIAFLSYFAGSLVPPTDEKMAQGFLGWNRTVLEQNSLPDFSPGESFFTMFAVFFPAMIGILAGANMSGDLKDPSSAIPKGTFWAIGFTSTTYVLVLLFLAGTVARYATGNVADLASGTFLSCPDSCKYGLKNYLPVMEMVSVWSPFIYLGIFAATLSSALACAVAAPRLLQALAQDNLFPVLSLFAKTKGPDRNPFNATLLCFVAIFFVSLIGNLNLISAFISNFYIFTYGVINLAAFHASSVNRPGFRPGFRRYNKWACLATGFTCFVIMFVMSWVVGLATAVLASFVYLYIHYVKPPVNWGSSTQASRYNRALSALQNLDHVEEHVKNYRPAILALTGNPGSRIPLVDLAHEITTEGTGLLICGHVLEESSQFCLKSAISDFNRKWLNKRKIPAFYTQVQADHFSNGVRCLLQSAGLGKLKPNILMMGFVNNFSNATPHHLEEYLRCIHHALDLHISIAILKVPRGLDFARHLEGNDQFPKIAATEAVSPDASTIRQRLAGIALQMTSMTSQLLEKVESDESYQYGIPSEELKQNMLRSVNVFKSPQQGRTVDVWWLNDDGGLTILLAHLLASRDSWRHCKLRVFCLASDPTRLQHEQITMATLCKKFRINVSDVTILPVLEPRQTSVDRFHQLVQPWMQGPHGLTQEILAQHAEKTKRFLRIRDLVSENSGQAALVVLTLPMPRKDSCPAVLYLSWLEAMTQDLSPPCLLVRGNQANVLTFYS